MALQRAHMGCHVVLLGCISSSCVLPYPSALSCQSPVFIVLVKCVDQCTAIQAMIERSDALSIVKWCNKMLELAEVESISNMTIIMMFYFRLSAWTEGLDIARFYCNDEDG